MVRCGKCSYTWAQSPPEIPDDPGADEPGADSAPNGDSDLDPDAESDLDTDFNSVFGSDSTPGRRRGTHGVPALRREPRRLVARLAWAALVIVFTGALLGGAVFQSAITAAWPPAGRIYAMIGIQSEPPGFGLNLVNIKPTPKLVDSKPFLLVEGEIENVSNKVRSVPNLRAALLDKDRKELQHWTFQAPVPRLLPGENVKFATRVRDPDSTTASVSIDFHEAK